MFSEDLLLTPTRRWSSSESSPSGLEKTVEHTFCISGAIPSFPPATLALFVFDSGRSWPFASTSRSYSISDAHTPHEVITTILSTGSYCHYVPLT